MKHIPLRRMPRHTPIRCTPVRYTPIRHLFMRCMLMNLALGALLPTVFGNHSVLNQNDGFLGFSLRSCLVSPSFGLIGASGRRTAPGSHGYQDPMAHRLGAFTTRARHPVHSKVTSLLAWDRVQRQRIPDQVLESSSWPG